MTELWCTLALSGPSCQETVTMDRWQDGPQHVLHSQGTEGKSQALQSSRLQQKLTPAQCDSIQVMHTLILYRIIPTCLSYVNTYGLLRCQLSLI